MSDRVGHLGEYISTSRWIMIVQIFGELHFVFLRDERGKLVIRVCVL